jgi:hypothetical protein
MSPNSRHRARHLRRRVLFFARGCLIGATFSAACDAVGAHVRLAWNPSVGTNVTGYALYYGTTSNSLTNRVNMGNQTTGTCSNLLTGRTYYFVVTAYNSTGLESLPSDQVVYTVPSMGTKPARDFYITSFTVNSNGAALTWNCTVGRTYRVLYKHALSEPQWISATPRLLATNSALQWLDASAVADRQRLYSIVMLPTNAVVQGVPPTHAPPQVLAPTITRFTVSSNQASLTWTTVPGCAYRVVFTRNMRFGTWGPASPDFFATGSSLQWVDTRANRPMQGYYAILLLP